MNESQKKIISEVHKIALQSARDNNAVTIKDIVDHINATYSFADIVESKEIHDLIYQAYSQASYSASLQQAIKNTFLKNDGQTPVISPDRITHFTAVLNDVDNTEMFADVKKTFVKLEAYTKTVQQNDPLAIIYRIQKEVDTIKAEKVFSITGSSKVQAKYEEAEKVYRSYKELIEKHELAKAKILTVFEDFEMIRNVLKDLRLDLTDKIMEIFGSNIRVTHPDIFDFMTVKWIDVSAVLGEINWHFATINDTCQTFFLNYEQIYNELGDAITTRLGAMTGRKGELKDTAINIAIEAFFSVSNSREESKNTVAKLNYEIENMKSALHKDINSIQVDVLRMLEIYKNVQEHIIPATRHFMVKFIQIYENELKHIFSEAESIPGVSLLKEQQTKLKHRQRYLETDKQIVYESLNDSRYAKDHYQNIVDNLRPEYESVLAVKPLPPRVFTRIITLGVADKIFVLAKRLWVDRTADVRTNYTVYVEFLENETTREKKHSAAYTKITAEESEIKFALDQNLNKLQILYSGSRMKERIADKLPEISKLTKVSKEVLEMKLTDNLKNAMY
jgi:hypothetical protein